MRRVLFSCHSVPQHLSGCRHRRQHSRHHCAVLDFLLGSSQTLELVKIHLIFSDHPGQTMMRTMMKMASVAAITLVLLCCSFITSTDACGHYVATGGNFAVPLNYQLEGTDTLKWKFNDEMIVMRKNNKIAFGNLPINPNGSLRLMNVQLNQTGNYIPEVFTIDGISKKGLSGTHVCVLDRVQKPTMTMKCLKTQVTFTCNVQQKGKDDKLEWLQDGQIVGNVNKLTLSKEIKEVKHVSFTCKVSNPVSSENSDAMTQNCVKSGFEFPQALFGISIWVFVGSGGAVVLMLIIIVIVCCVHARRKKRMQLKDEDELRLEWTNPQQEQQHRRHHHHHHQHNHPPDNHPHHHRPQQKQQQQPAGHTGPRQTRTKWHPKPPEAPTGHPKATPRQVPKPIDDEQPPPLPQPRTKTPRTQRI
ncbi:T-cell surface antigen CD2-like [Embiotoca jacksoni]|uniref:T-cell surface antigen CD2-like n=1 Tax=Embiotoca jacksoni TaxID=100190 RepID=UPI003704A969